MVLTNESVEHIFLEPKKYNPSAPMKSQIDEDVFNKYQSIAGKNPFEPVSPFPNKLMSRECFFPPIPAPCRIESTDPLTHRKIWVVPTTKDSSGLEQRFRSERSAPNLLNREAFGESTAAGSGMNHVPISDHDHFEPPSISPSTISGDDGTSNVRRALVKSLSDTNFRPNLAARRNNRDSNINLTIDSHATPINHWINTIDEKDLEYAANYKLEAAREPGETVKVIRSPLKKFFGDKGILGRSPSQKDLPDPRYKKSSGQSWSDKFKHRIDEVSKDISAAFPSRDRIKRQSHPHGPSNFPIRLSPYAQGDLYMQLELLLNTEVSEFIMNQFQYGNISVDSLKKIVEGWKNKGRPQVIGFRFDLATQRDLIILNAENLKFYGGNNFNRSMLWGIFEAWKSLAREVSVRTFCQPDSAIRKHLYDAEKVLELIGAAPDSMLAFQEMRNRAIIDMLKQEKLDRQEELN